ncbi:FAD-dependent oxidoreductase [Marinibaculum pumilum]|uniref:FAD-dependent oxidoreductase n=1 Tax=Marinibaculum pumilum TaxID=1766165 RepID=A0ABV7L580_9PROT
MNGTTLIAGAGPTGLAAGLALTRLGCPVRIVDRGPPTPLTESRALAVNPRSLELLEPSGVTGQLMAEGHRITRMHLHRWHSGRTRLVQEVPFGDLPHRFPFMLAIPQGRVEAVLEAALADQGVTVERGTELSGLAGPGRPRATLHGPHGAVEVHPEALLAADGAHSTARHALGLDFPGYRYEADWQLADYRLETDLAPDAGHVVLRPDGFLFMMRFGDGLWRAMSTSRDLDAILPEGCRIEAEQWRSSFRISHRVVEHFQVGQVYLAGDAAHLHSPLGARGMNLGIEDATVFAHLATGGRLAQYHMRRRKVDRAVVRQIDLLTRIATGASPLWRPVRDLLLPSLLGLKPVQRLARRRATGLSPSGGWD